MKQKTTTRQYVFLFVSMFLVTGMDNRQSLYQRDNVRGHLGSWGSLRCLSQFISLKSRLMWEIVWVSCVSVPLFTSCCFPYIACLWINARGNYCAKCWRLWIACWMPLHPCLESCNGFTTVSLAIWGYLLESITFKPC